jgi:hypothetical protein
MTEATAPLMTTTTGIRNRTITMATTPGMASG